MAKPQKKIFQIFSAGRQHDARRVRLSRQGRPPGCACCTLLGVGEEDTPVEIHHVREGQGMAQRAQHWLAVPLVS
jgi:hypothetical protein